MRNILIGLLIAVCMTLVGVCAALAEVTTPPAEVVFTLEMGLVFAVLVLVIALFIFEWVRVDVVGLMMMVLLPLLGWLPRKRPLVGCRVTRLSQLLPWSLSALALIRLAV